MKKQLQLLTAAVVASISFATAQNNASVQGNMHIHTGGNLTFFGAVDVPTGGLLRNEAGTLYTRADVTGEARIQIDEDANLNVSGGRFTFAHAQDEKLNNLTIATTGIIEVKPGNSIEVAGALENNNVTTADSAAGINLYANATGYAQLLTSGTVANKGVTYAQQYLTATANAGSRQLASPVATTLAQIDDNFQTYYPAAPGPVGIDKQWNVWWYDASPLTPGGGTSLAATNNGAASAKYWTAAANNAVAFGPANNARAYKIYSGGPFDILNGGVLDVNGAFGNGTYSYDCYQTHDKGFTYDANLVTDPDLITGWNLIPNPYPSNIDVTVLLDDNTNFDIPYKAVHVWDAKNQQYSAITDGVATNWNTISTLPEGTNNIAPFQAFWVKAYDDDLGGGGPGGSANATADHDIVLTNAHRTILDNANFFKKAPPVIRLNVYNATNGYRDQAILAFASTHQTGIEANDAYKFKSSNEEVPTLFTLAENHELSINRLPFPEPYHSVPMQLKSKATGAPFYIEMVTEEINPEWTILLEDKKLGTMHNLRSAVYEFVYDKNFTQNRFVVHINKTELKVDEYTKDNITIYPNADGINIAFVNPKASTANVVISNLAGQVMYSGEVTTGAVFTYPTTAEMMVFVVHVISGSKAIYEKVVR